MFRRRLHVNAVCIYCKGNHKAGAKECERRKRESEERTE